MIRLVLYFLLVALAAMGLSWLADRPGSLVVNWEGYEIETSVFRAVVMLALVLGGLVFVWSLISQLWSSPATLGRYIVRRRQERGLDALSSGMIAIAAGDRTQALKAAVQARKALPNEPMTHLLRAQAAELAGDRATSRRIFEAMLAQPDTEQLGLRGLYLEAEREGEVEAARQFAERALTLNPRLGWPVEALFDFQVREQDWDGALATLAAGKKSGQIEKPVGDRRRAVLLTAKAQELEDGNGAKALELAQEAHTLAPDLIPAAAISARQFAARGATAKAAKIIERTWPLAPHPELALVYAFARPGDSPRDRLERIKRLARMASQSSEGPIALATAAIEAKEYAEARAALAPLLEGGLTHRVCSLMSRIESEEKNDAGRAREWLARAAEAPADPAWVADGVVADRWGPISPITGLLDRYSWTTPPERAGPGADAEIALRKIDEVVLLGDAADAAAEKPNSDRARPGSPLRVRSAEADRPITVDVQPVASRDAERPGTSVPIHPGQRAIDIEEVARPTAPPSTAVKP